MKFRFHIVLCGTLTEITVESHSYPAALDQLGGAIENELSVQLAEIEGEFHGNQDRTIIACEHKCLVRVMPAMKMDRLRRSERVSAAIKHASRIWKG